MRVRVYLDERDHHEGKATWRALLEFLHAEGAAGVTILRAMAGFGAHSHIHAATLVDLASSLPIVVEWVDSEDQVGALMPSVIAMLEGGLVTTDPVEIFPIGARSAQGS
jgi:PII-like signaling protein